VAGHLQGTYFGRPIELEADGRDLLLRLPNLKAAWRLRHGLSSNMISLLRTLRQNGFRLRLRIGRMLAVNVLPAPNFAVRVLVPALWFDKP
jgi:hypothetical protein